MRGEHGDDNMQADEQYERIIAQLGEVKTLCREQAVETVHVKESLEKLYKEQLRLYDRLSNRIKTIEKENDKLGNEQSRQSGFVRGVIIVGTLAVTVCASTFALIYHSVDDRIKALVKYVHYLDDRRK